MAREEKQSCPEKLVATRRGESNRRGPLPPLEVAGSRQGGPEQPWGAGWPPGEGRAADGISSPWRWLAAARPARSSPGELGGHQGREEQPMVYLPHGGGRQPPGRLGVALGSWVAAREGESSRRCPSSPWRWLVVARAARSSQGNMEAHVGAGGHQERREQPAGRKCYGFSRWALSAKRIARLCVSRAK